jgi:ribosomal protein S18 acetylase RimI-like enzyme
MKIFPWTRLMQADVAYRRGTAGDVDAIVDLYRAVGNAGGGLARMPDEVTHQYVDDFIDAALTAGLELVAIDAAGTVVAEMHARPLGPRAFSHVLGDLTIAVHPAWQGRGVGRRLFAEFLKIVSAEMPHVLRVELKSRESNNRAISMYQSLGFEKEGRMAGRIQLPDGTLDADIPMAWHRAENV